MNQSLVTFLKEDLQVRHTQRSKKLSITINGVSSVENSISDLTKTIICNSNIYKNNVNWQRFKTETVSNLSGHEEFFEKLPDILAEHLSFVLSKKSDKSDIVHGKVEASAFNSFVKELSELPKIGFSEVDRMILSRVRYCQADNCIYIKKNGKLKLIGKLELLKKDPTQAGLCAFIKEEIGMHWNEGKPEKIDEYVSFCLNTATDLRHFLMKEVKKRIDAGEAFENITITLKDGSVFIPSEKCYTEDENALENAAHNYCIDRLWEMLPCSLFTARVITLKAIYNTYEKSGPNGTSYKINEFVKYIYDVVRSGEALTEATYLKNILNVYVAELKDDEAFKLNDVPRTYADGDVDVDALFKYDGSIFKKNLKGIECYSKVEDCENLMLLKSWMNEDEFRLAMAWAYSAVHPITVKSNIALLLWTGGGTGKSSLVAMIKYAMMMSSDAREEDLYFEIKGDKFVKDDKNWLPDGQIGVPKAALVNIDEATTECIEIYKNFSGSADKNKLTLRLNYENAIDYDVKGKFIFTTNRGLYLTSDDGSLLRRVAIIKHTDTRNILGDKPKTNEEIVLEYKKQIPMMLKLGKQALKEISELGYASIDAYAMQNENITMNLKESTYTTANLALYETVWTLLEEKFKNEKCYKDGAFRLQGGALRAYYNKACIMNGESTNYFNNFKKFIADNPSIFVRPYEIRAASNFIGVDGQGQLEFKDRVSNNIYFLYPLKNNN